MSNGWLSDDIVYHGHQSSAGANVISVESTGGALLGLLPTYGTPSAIGFTWGHSGSGAAHTARCLLLAAFDDPYCLACRGAGKTVNEPFGERPFEQGSDDPFSPRVADCDRCWEQDGFRPVPFQQFKWDYVVDWPSEWRITRADVRDWLTVQGRPAD